MPAPRAAPPTAIFLPQRPHQLPLRVRPLQSTAYISESNTYKSSLTLPQHPNAQNLKKLDLQHSGKQGFCCYSLTQDARAIDITDYYPEVPAGRGHNYDLLVSSGLSSLKKGKATGVQVIKGAGGGEWGLGGGCSVPDCLCIGGCRCRGSSCGRRCTACRHALRCLKLKDHAAGSCSCFILS